MTKKYNKAFTLVELAIVIVIIGLIVAGVLAGQGLVQQAQLRSIISEQDQIKVALQNFRLIYDAEPGDFDDAYTYWNCGASEEECNGNGDGLIQTNKPSVGVNMQNNDKNYQLASMALGFNLVAAAPSSAPLPYGQIEGSGTDNEGFRAWQHLNAAGLFPGNFSGISLDANDSLVDNPNYMQIGANVPASKFNGAGLSFGTPGYITISGDSNPINIYESPIFSEKQAYSIDAKIDDGRPYFGSVGTYCAGYTTSTNHFVISAPPEYNLNSEDTNCIIAISLKGKVLTEPYLDAF